MLLLSNLLVKKTARNVFFNSKLKKGLEKVGLWQKVGEIRVKFGRPINKKVTGLSGPAGQVAQKLAIMASDTDLGFALAKTRQLTKNVRDQGLSKKRVTNGPAIIMSSKTSQDPTPEHGLSGLNGALAQNLAKEASDI